MNPHDPQMMRIFREDGAFHTVTANNNGGMARDGVCIALDGDKLKPRENPRKGGNVVVECRAIENHPNDSRVKVSKDNVCQTISSRCGTGGGNEPMVVFNKVSHACGKNGEGERWAEGDVASTRNVFDISETRTQELVVGMKQKEIAQMRYIVRRLTPTECCRLMGLPDGWTIPSNLVITDELVEEFRQIHDNFNHIMAEYEGGKPPKPKTAAQVCKWLEKITNPDTCPDAPQYKGCGNGWATNQPRWIVLRMLAKDGIDPWGGEE